MVKIKAFDIFLTVAAFAALIFLLPADRDGSNSDAQKTEIRVSLLR